MNQQNDKPALLKALEIIVASPESIKKETDNLIKKFQKKYSGNKTDETIHSLVAKKIISNYSYFCAFYGGATSLTGIVPGVGTITSAVGGASADIVLCMKYQIEMTMALAHLHDHDIESEEGKRICFLIAGLGAINKATCKSGQEIGTKAFIKIIRQYLKGSTLTAVKEVFKKVGITFTRKSLEKSIPFGVGCVLGITINKGMALYVGNKGQAFFSA